jgi:ATPase subunit of ABC transporter with duplicated ATPase domains
MSAIDKQKQHMQSFVDKQRSAARDQSSKGGDPKKQQQIKSRLLRMEKLDRFRADGKKIRQSYAVHGTIAQDHADKTSPIKINACDPLPASAGAIIELRGMGLQYPNTDTRVLDGVEAQLWQHSSVAIVGPNGCGKTSLVRVLVGDVAPTQGQSRQSNKRVLLIVFVRRVLALASYYKRF